MAFAHRQGPACVAQLLGDDGAGVGERHLLVALADAEVPDSSLNAGVRRRHDGGHGLGAVCALGDHGGLGGAHGHRQRSVSARRASAAGAVVVGRVVLLGDDDVVVHQLAVLHVDDVVDGVLQPQARQQKGRAAGDADDRHDEGGACSGRCCGTSPSTRTTGGATEGRCAPADALAGLGSRRLHEGGRVSRRVAAAAAQVANSVMPMPSPAAASAMGRSMGMAPRGT